MTETVHREKTERDPDFDEQLSGWTERPIRRLVGDFGAKYWVYVVLGITANIVGTLVSLIPNYIFGVAVDAIFTDAKPFTLPYVPQSVLPTGRTDQLFLVIGIVVGASGLAIVMSSATLWALTLFSQYIQHDLRTAAYRCTQGLSIEFHDRHSSGDIISVLSNDVNELNEFLESWLNQALQSVIFTIGLLGILLWLNWELTLVAVLPLPLIALVSVAYSYYLAPRYKRLRDTVGAMQSEINSNVRGIRTIKSFVQERAELDDIRSLSARYRDINLSVVRTSLVFQPLTQFLIEYGYVLTLAVGGLWVISGPPLFFSSNLSFGTFVTFMLYSQQLSSTTASWGTLVNEYQDAKASARRVFGLIDAPTSRFADVDTGSERAVGHIEFDGVTFSYSSNEDPAVRDISFEVEAGETIGIVGPTGSGKTTLLNLLLGFYDYDEGEIAVDGVSLDNWEYEHLRHSFGYVPQDPHIFEGTIRENITYASDQISDGRLEEVGHLAGVAEFVEQLSNGYETEVGEDGVQLSGGQRKRLALARAVFDDPPILLFDETLSEVDTRTEAMIYERLAPITDERTTVRIAHRLSSVKDADRILVIEEGEIVERGAHDSLLERDGLYAQLWRIQTGKRMV